MSDYRRLTKVLIDRRELTEYILGVKSDENRQARAWNFVVTLISGDTQGDALAVDYLEEQEGRRRRWVEENGYE